ncbi:hypothetical protein BD770DRAFT_446711 [Pilaira anomala]|nr:hypothetical protein BD770DRAFT_446711 [Pilaira anomala]
MNHPSYSNGYYDAYQHQYYAIDAKYDPYHVAFKTQSMEAMLTCYVPRRKQLSTMATNVANKTGHIFAKSIFSLLDHIRIDNKPPRRLINNSSDSTIIQEKPIENDWEIVEKLSLSTQQYLSLKYFINQHLIYNDLYHIECQKKLTQYEGDHDRLYLV